MRLTLQDDALDLQKLRSEMDGYFEMMQDFQMSDPRENLSRLSAFTARMSYVRTRIIRGEADGGSKEAANFRTKELDPFISECDRQFKIWSRLVTVAQLDYELSRGGR